MTTLLFANYAITTLALPVAPGDLSVTLAAGSGPLFPSPSTGQIFKLTLSDAATGLVNEICNATARNGDVVTVQRAQEGTMAQSWLAGDAASSLITAGTLYALQNAALSVLPPTRATVSGAGPYTTQAYASFSVVVYLDGVAQPPTAYTYVSGSLTLLVDPTLYQNLLVTGLGTNAYQVALPPTRLTVSGSGPYSTAPYDPANVVVFLDGTAQPTSAYTYVQGTNSGALNLLIDSTPYQNLLVTG